MNTWCQLITEQVKLGGDETHLVPSFMGYIEKAKKEVCNADCLQLEIMYHVYLILENIDHSEGVFVQYMQECGEKNCPEGGVISYVDGKVQCSVHSRGDDVESDEDDDNGSVPFL